MSQNSESFPKGLGYAFAFQCANALSFSIVTGPPMLAYFKSLDASATVLGIAGAIAPLMIMLQIPAAKYLDRIGYRAFVLKGWSFRSFCVLIIAAIAFMPDSVSNANRILLLLGVLSFYSMARGISSCGFLPWMTQLVPERVRGKYLSWDSFCMTASSTVTLVFCGLLLQNAEGHHFYGWAFVLSFVSGIVSLFFLRKIPDVPIVRANASEPIPWKEMFTYRPFLKLLILSVVCQAAFAGGGIFWIPLTRDQFHFTSSEMMYLASFSSGASLLTLYWSSAIMDRVGSRPMMFVGLLLFAFHFVLWAGAGAGYFKFTLPFIIVLQLSVAFGAPLYNVANVRLLMKTVPKMGRSHFFALFSVITNLTLGVMPVIWGMGLDYLEGWNHPAGRWLWNNYSLMYIVLAFILGVGMFLVLRVKEEQAMSTQEFFDELFIRTPKRAITRLFSLVLD